MKLLGHEFDEMVESFVGERSGRPNDVGSGFAVDESVGRGRSLCSEGKVVVGLLDDGLVKPRGVKGEE